MCNILSFEHVMTINMLMRYFIYFFKIPRYFTLTALLVSKWLYFKCTIATCTSGCHQRLLAPSGEDVGLTLLFVLMALLRRLVNIDWVNMWVNLWVSIRKAKMSGIVKKVTRTFHPRVLGFHQYDERNI